MPLSGTPRHRSGDPSRSAIDHCAQRIIKVRVHLGGSCLPVPFGVNCWHINEHESEAMWQLYTAAGQGIAIESTKARLEGALKGDGIHVDRVRYMDFDFDEIEKGHTHYGLFLKRKSFAHEQELRATILLPTPGMGTAVPCDLNALITQIHIFPKAPPYYAEAVRYAVGLAVPEIKAPVVVSRLLDPPDY